MMKQTRRDFLKKTTLAMATAAFAVPMFVPRTVFAQGNRPGANERLGIGAIGVGRQGSPVLNTILRDQRTVPVALCDVWKRRAIDNATNRGFPLENAFQDYRRVIDHKDVDAVLVATTEHWRGPMCVGAALAGKHLYVEKPITLTVDDGKRIRAAVKKTGVKFQSGSQQRSDRINDLACRFIREGGLGEIKEVIAANFESPWFANLPAQEMPEDLDWDMWCGPVEPVPYHIDLFTARRDPGWLSIWEFSGGEMTGWGTHGLDQIQCALGMDNTGPVEIIVEGEKLVPPVYAEPESRDRGNRLCSVPNLSYRYANGITVTLDKEDRINRGGGLFIGEKGRVEIFRSRATSNPAELMEEYLREHAEHRLPGHELDWINCIYNGNAPIGDLETGIRTTTICHILSIARYLGRSLKWDPVKEEFIGDADANTWLKREQRKGFETPEVS